MGTKLVPVYTTLVHVIGYSEENVSKPINDI